LDYFWVIRFEPKKPKLEPKTEYQGCHGYN